MLLRQAISKGGILNEVLSLNAQESPHWSPRPERPHSPQ